MEPFDPNEKRSDEGTQIGHIRLLPGSGLDNLVKSVSSFKDRYQAKAGITGDSQFNVGDGRAPVGSTSSVVRPAARVPALTPVATPSKIVSSRPSFAGVQGNVVTPPQRAARGVARSIVNGVPTFTGTGAYAPDKAVAAPTAVARPAFTDPRIAPLATPGVVNQSENTDQRRAREAAISEIGTQLFLNRGKTTRSARDLTSDLLKTQADLTNTAGNQAVSMKNANLDAQTRLDAVGLQNQGENDRAVVDARAANEAVAWVDAGKTERERLKLEKPEHVIGFDGSLLSVSDAVAVPVLNGNTPVRLQRPGAITPAIALESTQNELAASQQSLTPDPERVGVLQRQVDVLRRPNAGPLPGDVVDGFRFRGGDPRLKANWERLGGGEP